MSERGVLTTLARALFCVWCLMVVFNRTADAAPAKDRGGETVPTLLLAPPAVYVQGDSSRVDIIAVAMRAGLHEAAGALPVKEQIISSELLEEDRLYGRALEAFGDVTGQRTTAAATARRVGTRHHYAIRHLIQLKIEELATGNYLVTIRLHTFSPRKPFSPSSTETFQFGGCSESIDELAQKVRAFATTIFHPPEQSNLTTKVHVEAPEGTIAFDSDSSDEATVLLGTKIFLDVCSTRNPRGLPYYIEWESDELLPHASGRRVSLSLDQEGTHQVKVRLSPTVAPFTSSEATMRLQVIRRPEARPGLYSAELPGAERTVPLTLHENIVRIPQGKRVFILLWALELSEGDDAAWQQTSGPAIVLPKNCDVRCSFVLDWESAGHYEFQLTVSNSAWRDTRKIEFIAAPELRVDAGPDRRGRAGEEIVLDGAGSYDVLGDSLFMTWVAADSGSDADVRILDPHSVRPRFRADRPGVYEVRLFVRTTRKIGAVAIADIGTDSTTVIVEEDKTNVAVGGGFSSVYASDAFVSLALERALRSEPNKLRFNIGLQLEYGRQTHTTADETVVHRRPLSGLLTLRLDRRVKWLSVGWRGGVGASTDPEFRTQVFAEFCYGIRQGPYSLNLGLGGTYFEYKGTMGTSALMPRASAWVAYAL